MNKFIYVFIVIKTIKIKLKNAKKKKKNNENWKILIKYKIITVWLLSRLESNDNNDCNGSIVLTNRQ